MYLGSKATELHQCFQDREGALWKMAGKVRGNQFKGKGEAGEMAWESHR